MGGRAVARVLLDSPLPQLDRLFDYAIPDAMDEEIVPGIRVKVPLRTAGRIVDAYVVERGEAVDPDRPLSEIDAVVSSVRVLPPSLYTLARRVADRAAGSASDILRLVIPKRQVRVEKAWVARRDAEAQAVSGSPADAEAAGDTAPVAGSASSAPGAEWARAVLETYPALTAALDADKRVALDAPARPARTHAQSGSGAWAVLLAAAAAHTLAGGRSAVVVVPDHRDLDQIERALEGLVPPQDLVRDDAARPAADRYRGYLRILERRPVVVIGNRSSVYSPVHRPGLVAVWDDGDPLLDEPLAPYVHARDAALVRQGLDGGALLLAGHTRTSDVERLVRIGWVGEAAPKRKYAPRVILSATREGERPGARIPSAAFAAAREALESGPVLVQVARPGYAPSLVCGDCRRPARCVHCAGPLHAPRKDAPPVCRWCGRTAMAWRCASCDGTTLRLASSGSTRTADELGRAFPGTRVIVADGTHPIRSVAAAPALVIATRGAEPEAEGGYRAVLLLDGERMLMAESLRIAEDCLRWWSNAAALAAPGAPVHLVGVAGRIARALATWTQPAFAAAELEERAPLRMPPTARVAAVEGEPTAVEKALSDLRAHVPLAADAILGPVDVPPGERERGAPPRARAIVRFDYAHGADVARALRASVVAASVRGRRSPRGAAPRNTLRVRVDVPDPEL
ncbi:primosomal protein N' [Microbacterium sp. NPDC078428]|uniref:primosomal protein N' family DNA-binding protein n=1 Tax=Microbacterium sp. NPDC078428 TaxID=3364190 RepID=UPI0037CB1203